MLSQSSILYRQARTLSSFSASLCVRVCSSQLCKNLGDTKRHEPRVDKVLDTGKRSFELRYRSLSTASCYLKESRTTADEPGDNLKDESNFNSGFFDEEDADISNLQKTRSKLRSAFADYTLDEDGYMNIQDLVEFLRRESAIDICVIKTRGNRQTYVDYFVVVSGVSTRHIRAMAKNLEQLVGRHEVLMDWVARPSLKIVLLEVLTCGSLIAYLETNFDMTFVPPPPTPSPRCAILQCT